MDHGGRCSRFRHKRVAFSVDTWLPLPYALRPSFAKGCLRRCACGYVRHLAQPTKSSFYSSCGINSGKGRDKFLTHCAPCAQDLQFRAKTHTIRIRNRPAKQVGDQRWLNLHSLNRGSTRQSVLCAVSASPECLMNRGEPHRLRTGSPAHCPRPSGSDFYFYRIPPGAKAL